MYTPIIVPIVSSGGSDSRCPECGKTENIKRVCAYCGHEYKESSSSGWEILFMFLIVTLITVFVGWFLFTLVDWLTGWEPLREVLKGQWEWLRNLKI